MMCSCAFATFLYGVIGQVWYLIVWIPDLCLLPCFYIKWYHHNYFLPDRAAQFASCLTADPGVTSLISAQSHTLVEIDHEIFYMAFLLPLADSRFTCWISFALALSFITSSLSLGSFR